MSIIRRCAAVTLATGLAVSAAAGPASAAGHGGIGNNQAGLINVGVVVNDVLNDNTVIVQVPVAVALNLCDVNVNVLGIVLQNGDEVTCEAFAQSEADA